MSRGNGKIENAILGLLQAEGVCCTRYIAAKINDPGGPNPEGYWNYTPSQYASVRRSLHSLRRKALTFRIGRGRNAQEQWATRDTATSEIRDIVGKSLGVQGLQYYNKDLLSLYLEITPPQSNKATTND